MIVKIQVPIGGTDGPALVYNEDRSVNFHSPIDEFVRKIMGKEPKKFFYAEKTMDGGAAIGKEAPWQDW